MPGAALKMFQVKGGPPNQAGTVWLEDFAVGSVDIRDLSASTVALDDSAPSTVTLVDEVS